MTERVLRSRGASGITIRVSSFVLTQHPSPPTMAVKRSLPPAWVTGADASTTAATQGGHPS